jgi:hypothetical protein
VRITGTGISRGSGPDDAGFWDVAPATRTQTAANAVKRIAADRLCMSIIRISVDGRRFYTFRESHASPSRQNSAPSDSIDPIIRLAMLMGNGNYDNCSFINAVNQRIRKAYEEEASDFRLNLHARVGIKPHESNDPIQFIQEFTTKASSLVSYHWTASSTSR